LVATVAHNELAPAPPIPPTLGKIGVGFDPVKAITMGGTANVQILAPVLPTDEMPSAIEIHYVPNAAFTAPLTLAMIDGLAGLSSAIYSVPTPAPAPLTTFPIQVAPPPPNGWNTVAVVAVYPT
jgi:hypothetical protein